MLKSHELLGFMSPALANDILTFIFESDKPAYKAALGAVAEAKRVRPVFLERQPRDARNAAMLTALTKPNLDPAAGAFIRAWLVKKHVAMLMDFLNALEIKNENGVVEDLPGAVTLNAMGFTVQGIRIGYRLMDAAPRPNPRMLRLIYPFPYRPMLVAEAKERKLDPFMVAALIRQESSFQAQVASGVGARGLMQVMPETGKALARAAGIDGWKVSLLYQPEINAHLGTLFLADQMASYDGSLPSVFAAYNAGPSRVERWERFPEARDAELFTERIPYRETREYVKILTRNIAIYRGLYGE